MGLNLNVNDCLPDDIDDAILLGRAWVPGHVSGPSPIIIREGRVFDLSNEVTTVSELLNAEAHLDIIEDIRSIGFSIDVFGKNSVVINGIPSGLDDINEKEIIEGFVEEVKNNNLDLKSQKRDIILKSFSKKARITNSRNLSQTEMNLIIDRLFACENPKYSPDGKQNYIELGIDKVENLF